MKREKCIALLVMCGLAANLSFAGKKAADPSVEASKAVARAEQAVAQTKAAIEASKALVGGVSGNAALMAEVKEMLRATTDDWEMAIAALDQAKKNAERVASSKDEVMAKDYARLTKLNAGIAISGAKVVSTGLYFVEAAASGKVESLDVIRGAMSAARVSAESVRVSSERTIGLIEAKYSK
jgi:hypothetical protein